MQRKIPMLTDYHTHTPLCLHAEGNPVDYARHAQSIGLAEIGLSDHNPMPEKFDDWRMLLSDLPRYFELVNEARAALPDFPIRLALECDHIEGYQKWIDETAAMADWDYLIGSVHYIHDGIAVDDPKHVSRWKTASDIEHMWGMYWKLYAQMIRTKQFDFHAHPDLAKRFGLRPAGDLRPYYEPVIQALVDTKGILEVSTAGLRKDVREIYPAREMLEMAFAAQVPIVINSDAHLPTDVGVDFNQALDLVRSVGYTTTVRFEQRQRKVVPLPEGWPL
jgi:histidinol-phosphatase (PHP family)